MKCKTTVLIGCCSLAFAYDAQGDAPFRHPGIGLNRKELKTIVSNVRGGVEPWKSAYDWLVEHDERFDRAGKMWANTDETNLSIDNPGFDDRCLHDSQVAVAQELMYLITKDDVYRQNALRIVRWYWQNVRGGKPHWDSQFRWPNAERWYLAACELLRWTPPKEGPLAWTDEDTKGVDALIASGENLWWGRRTFLNQLQFALGGQLARAVWRDDRATYDEMVEILTVNADGPVGEFNGSIRELCRLVTSNEVTGVAVKPHVQFTEMGRDIGHPWCFGELSGNLAILRSQGTKVDPETGRVSVKSNAVEPIEFLSHRVLRGWNQICKYNLGFDIDWTPIYIERAKNAVWERPDNSGGGRGRIVAEMDLVYSHYRWKRGLDLDRSEETRYFAYANRLRGTNPWTTLLYTPSEAAGKWKDERIDPGRDGVLRFAEFIQSKAKDSRKNFILPLFLCARPPLPKPGEYVLRYRTDGRAMMGVINPEDYATEFKDGIAATKRKYVERVALPDTKGEWKEYALLLKSPPCRNLVKLHFATHGSFIEIDWLRVPL